MTRRYYIRSTAEAVAAYNASNELALGIGKGATATTVAESVSKSSEELTHAWCSPAGVPNVADWPSGTYRVVFNVTDTGGDLTFGFLSTIKTGGGFHRLDSGAASILESADQAEGAFSLAGIKTATVSWDPSAGNASDRFALVLAVANTNDKDAQSITIEVDDPTANELNGGLSEGPWAAATNIEYVSAGLNAAASGQTPTANTVYVSAGLTGQRVGVSPGEGFQAAWAEGISIYVGID